MDRIKFLSKLQIDEKTGCWLWVAGQARGYGIARLNKPRRTIATHRLAWSLFIGPIPEGLWVLHKCDIKACCNPKHLYLGTVKDNHRDRVLRNRAPCNSWHWNSKLTAMQVKQAKQSRGKGELTKLAAKWGVSRSTLYQIRCGASRKSAEKENLC